MLPAFAIAALFSGVGVYMLIGRFIYDALRRARTAYGVTDQRVVIRTTLLGRRVTSLDLRTLTDVSLAERSTGRGTITFGPQGQTSQLAAAGWPTSGPVSPRFEGVADARNVYERIRRAQRGA